MHAIALRFGDDIRGGVDIQRLAGLSRIGRSRIYCAWFLVGDGIGSLVLGWCRLPPLKLPPSPIRQILRRQAAITHPFAVARRKQINNLTPPQTIAIATEPEISPRITRYYTRVTVPGGGIWAYMSIGQLVFTGSGTALACDFSRIFQQ